MRVAKRRRRENKTNYSKRLKMLRGERPRAIVRRTNKYLIAQYVTSEAAKDKIEIGITSKKLLNHGWPKEFAGSLKSLSASYLTGYLFGKLVQKEKKETPIVDLGMAQTLHKTKLFAFLKGAIDSGLKIPCKKEAFPEEERIQGKSLKEDFSKKFIEIKSNLDKI
jgi:large subunit ribosomal protein L18